MAPTVPDRLAKLESVLAETRRIRQACRGGTPLSTAALHLSVHGLAEALAELVADRLEELAGAELEHRAGPVARREAC